jgi:uncharacterized protein (TIGR01777 family)
MRMERSNRVAILGVTGFIGSGLPRLLRARNLAVTGVSRSSSARLEGVEDWHDLSALDLAGFRAVINLAGAPIARRWTAKARAELRESRVGVTQRVVGAIRQLPPAERPRILINGSAVGIYGNRGDQILDERTAPGDDFLARLCRDWEEAALAAENLGVGVILLRTGIVLDTSGGALATMLPTFKLGLGGALGSGCQWMPWIHLADARAAIVHALDSSILRGPVNLTAPTPERNAAFTRELAAQIRRPAVLRAPAYAMKLGLGEFGEALLASQRAVPAALQTDGFSFKFPTLRGALTNLLA